MHTWRMMHFTNKIHWNFIYIYIDQIPKLCPYLYMCTCISNIHKLFNTFKTIVTIKPHNGSNHHFSETCITNAFSEIQATFCIMGYDEATRTSVNNVSKLTKESEIVWVL